MVVTVRKKEESVNPAELVIEKEKLQTRVEAEVKAENSKGKNRRKESRRCNERRKRQRNC